MQSTTSSAVALAFALALGACSTVTATRLQPETVDVGPGQRPIAAIQANAISAYVLFIPVPGGVSLDNVVNRMLIASAKRMGADRVTNLQFDVTPDQGIYALRKLLGWRSGRASGIAVQITDLPPDPNADQGPEPETPPPAQPDEPE